MIDEAEVGLVNERRWLQRMPRALMPKLAGGDPPQLGVHERQQAIEGTSIPTTPFGKQRRDVLNRRHRRTLNR